jgi:hypothetical protein
MILFGQHKVKTIPNDKTNLKGDFCFVLVGPTISDLVIKWPILLSDSQYNKLCRDWSLQAGIIQLNWNLEGE